MPVAVRTRPINLMFKPWTPGVFLRLLREAHDLSQAALGEKINVSAKREVHRKGPAASSCRRARHTRCLCVLVLFFQNIMWRDNPEAWVWGSYWGTNCKDESAFVSICFAVTLASMKATRRLSTMAPMKKDDTIW